MSSSLRLEDNEPIRIYPDDFAVWLTAVPTDEIANIIGDVAFNKLMMKYEEELEVGDWSFTLIKWMSSLRCLRGF